MVLANSEFAVMSIHASRTNGRNRSTVAAVHNEVGKRVMESILETQKETIQSFLKGLTGRVHVTFEEGTHAAWLYGVTTRSSAEYEVEKGRVRRRVKSVVTRGLNTNYNHRLKYVFKSAALGGIHREPFASFYQDLIRRGMRSEMARLTLARKIAAVTLRIWKKGERFNELRLKRDVT